MSRPLRRVLLAATCAAVAGPIVIFPQPAGAERGLWGGVTYQLAKGVDGTNEFTGDVSPLGLGIDFRYLVHDALSLGIYGGWSSLYQRKAGVFSTSEGDLGGVSYRYLNVYPLLLGVHGYVPGHKVVRPFGGLSAGAYLVERRFDVGLFKDQQSSAHFGLAPEIGLGFKVQPGTAIVVYARYHYAFEAASAPPESFFTLNLGFAAFQ